MSVKTVTVYGQKPNGSRVPLPITEDGKLDTGWGDSEEPAPVTLATALAGLVAGVENDNVLVAPIRRADAFNNTPAELTASTSAQSVKAGTASKSIYVTDISVSVDVAMWVKFQDDTGTPVQIIGKKYLPANSVWSKHYSTPKQVPTGKALNIVCSVSSGNVSVDLDGYVI